MTDEKWNKIKELTRRRISDETALLDEFTYKPSKWSVDLDVCVSELPSSQQEQAMEIIRAYQTRTGITVLPDMLNALSRAGFRGDLVSRMQLNLPPLLYIDKKDETDNLSK